MTTTNKPAKKTQQQQQRTRDGKIKKMFIKHTNRTERRLPRGKKKRPKKWKTITDVTSILWNNEALADDFSCLAATPSSLPKTPRIVSLRGGVDNIPLSLSDADTCMQSRTASFRPMFDKWIRNRRTSLKANFRTQKVCGRPEAEAAMMVYDDSCSHFEGKIWNPAIHYLIKQRTYKWPKISCCISLS